MGKNVLGCKIVIKIFLLFIISNNLKSELNIYFLLIVNLVKLLGWLICFKLSYTLLKVFFY